MSAQARSAEQTSERTALVVSHVALPRSFLPPCSWATLAGLLRSTADDSSRGETTMCCVCPLGSAPTPSFPRSLGQRPDDPQLGHSRLIAALTGWAHSGQASKGLPPARRSAR